MTENQHQIEWRGDVPVSKAFDDPFYSLEDGLAESRYVFLAGNALPDRFVDGFHIAELGFGTGLNFLVALRAFRDAGTRGKLLFTSFEAFPMSKADVADALRPFEGLPKELFRELDLSAPEPQLSGPDFELRVMIGDALGEVGGWQDRADAWFLDGFAPARNPQMWSPELMAEVARHTAPDGTFATYTAVGSVRRALADQGFEVERIQGYGRKRHMTIGKLRAQTALEAHRA